MLTSIAPIPFRDQKPMKRKIVFLVWTNEYRSQRPFRLSLIAFRRSSKEILEEQRKSKLPLSFYQARFVSLFFLFPPSKVDIDRTGAEEKPSAVDSTREDGKAPRIRTFNSIGFEISSRARDACFDRSDFGIR